MSLFTSFAFAKPTQASLSISRNSIPFESSLRRYEPSPKPFSHKNIINKQQCDARSELGSTSENNLNQNNTVIDLKKKIKISGKQNNKNMINNDDGDKENLPIHANTSIFRGQSYEEKFWKNHNKPLVQEEQNCLNIDQLLFNSYTPFKQDPIIQENKVRIEDALEEKQDEEQLQMQDQDQCELDFIEPIKNLSKTDSSGLVLKPAVNFSIFQAQPEQKMQENLQPVFEIESQNEEQRVEKEHEKKEIHIKTKLSLRILKRKLAKKSAEQVAKEMMRHRKIQVQGSMRENEKKAVYEALLSFLKHELNDI